MEQQPSLFWEGYYQELTAAKEIMSMLVEVGTIYPDLSSRVSELRGKLLLPIMFLENYLEKNKSKIQLVRRIGELVSVLGNIPHPPFSTTISSDPQFRRVNLNINLFNDKISELINRQNLRSLALQTRYEGETPATPDPETVALTDQVIHWANLYYFNETISFRRYCDVRLLCFPSNGRLRTLSKALVALDELNAAETRVLRPHMIELGICLNTIKAFLRVSPQDHSKDDIVFGDFEN